MFVGSPLFQPKGNVAVNSTLKLSPSRSVVARASFFQFISQTETFWIIFWREQVQIDSFVSTTCSFIGQILLQFLKNVIQKLFMFKAENVLIFLFWSVSYLVL